MDGLFADALTSDVYHRVLSPAAFRKVGGLALYGAMRRIDVVLAAQTLDDLRSFPALGLRSDRAETWRIDLGCGRGLVFEWNGGPRALSIT